MNINLWQVAGDPSGNFLIGAKGEDGNQPGGLVDQHLWVYNINQTNGTLTAVSGSPFPSLNAPNQIIFHPNGKFVYDFSINPAGNNDAALEGFSMDSTTGMLTPIAGSPFTNVDIPFGGAFEQTGTYLFLHEPNLFSLCSVDPNTGIPTELTTQHVTGNLPWAVTDVQ